MKTITTSILLLLLSLGIAAQNVNNDPVISRNQKGIVESVEFSVDSTTGSITQEDFLSEYLKISVNDEFRKVEEKQRRIGFTNDHFDQYYKGVKADGGGYNFHYKAGKMYYAHGHYVKIGELDVSPTITAEKARDLFADYKKIPSGTVVGFTSELLIKEIQSIAQRDSTVYLVFKIYLRADHPNNDEIGFVDAKTGEILWIEPILTHAISPATGTFATRYNGSRQATTDDAGGFHLEDLTRGAAIHTWDLNNNTLISNRVELTDNDNNWTTAEHGGNEDDMGLDVHWAFQQIYDRLNNAHSINSFDDPASGPGFPIDAHIHYGNSSNDRDNAYWDGTNDVLLFGDGDTDFRPLASVDVVAHEYGHGITDFQIGWGSAGDQGAFNEGMSDVWGALMEFRINPGNVWQMGEQLTLTADCLRDLQNTNSSNAKNKIADTYGSSQYNGTSDKYVKSGVLSHWAYLLANGGSGINGVSNSYNVQGVGMDLLEDLIVTAVFNNFLDNTTTYAQVRTGMINAAKSLCSNQYGFLVQQVENA